MRYHVLAALLLPAVLATNVNLPALPGPHTVGTVSFALTDTSRLDPFAPVPQNRTIVVSAFYPTLRVRRYPEAPYAPPLTAAALDVNFNVPNGTVESIISRAHLGAHIHKPYPPIVLFSPGFNSLRLIYTSMASSLAS